MEIKEHNKIEKRVPHGNKRNWYLDHHSKLEIGISINTTAPLASETPNYSISKRERIGKEKGKTTRKSLKHPLLHSNNGYNVSGDIPANFPSAPLGYDKPL